MIHATRAERLEKNMEERRRKKMNLVLEKERLVKGIEKMGAARRLLRNILKKKEKKKKKQEEKKSALKIQLGFRQKVLGVDCDKSLFFVK